MRVSPYIQAIATDITQDVHISTTTTESFSVGLSVSIKGLITIGAGFDWNKSTSLDVTYHITVKKGQTVYVAFTPFYSLTNGTVTTYETMGTIRRVVGTQSVWGRCPQLLNGQTDGILATLEW